jgi:carboxyl-terminal processing protease
MTVHDRIKTTRRREMVWAALGMTALLALFIVLAQLLSAGEARGETAPGRTAEERQLDLESFDWIWTTIRDKHFDPDLGGLDWQAVRDSLRPRVERADSLPEARAAMRRMISLLDQSHFQVIPGHVLEALGERPGPGSPGGTTGMDVRVVDGRALVTRVETGSPAESLGVRPGWEIVRVKDEDLAPLIRRVAEASRDVAWKDLDLAAVALSRIEGRIGERGTIRFRDGRGDTVDLELRLVEKKGWLARLGPIPKVRVRFESRRLPGNVGYIRFNAFIDPVRLMPAYESAIRSFQDADGIVIDLRGNEGGMIPIAMGMAGWLVSGEERFLGTFHFRETQIKAIVVPRLGAYARPVAVLVDGVSISCAEAFAGGLQDLGRARVFGTRSAGMVLASAIEKLPNGDAFQYVFASYRSAKGQVLEGRGVIPDVQAPPTRAALLRGEDSALEAAVDWILGQKRPQEPADETTSSNTHRAAEGR